MNPRDFDPNLYLDVQDPKNLVYYADSSEDGCVIKDRTQIPANEKNRILADDQKIKDLREQVKQLKKSNAGAKEIPPEEKFTAVKRATTAYLQQQLNRLQNINATDSEKYKSLNTKKQEIERTNQMEDLHSHLSTIKDTVSKHRENRETHPLLWFFKFNWLRKPKSYNEFNKVFDNDFNLRNRKK